MVALTCILIILKLLDIIDWDWKWVLSPIWLTVLIKLCIAVLVGIPVGILWIIVFIVLFCCV